MCWKALLSSLLVLTIFCVIVGLSDGAEWASRLPNIGYSGRGYDMFRANPRPARSLVDPGYVAAVVNTIDRTEDRMSGDTRYMLPDRVEVRECQSCQQSMDVNEINSLDDFKKGSGLKIEYGYKGIIFRVRTSSTYEEVVKQTTELNHVLVNAEAECSYYCANVRVYEIGPGDLALNFRHAVERLSTDYLSYNAFAWMFGTHFITRVKMGSLFWQRSVHEREEWATTKHETNTSEKVTRIMGGVHQNRVSMNVTHEEQNWVDTLAAKSINRDIFSTGSDINRTSMWIEVSKNQPMPIAISLYPLSMLLTSKYFPNDGQIDEKRRNFEFVIENGSYCEFLLRASIGMSDINGDCYKTRKQVLTPAAPIAFVPCPTGFGGTFATAGLYSGTLENYLTNDYTCPVGFTANPIVQLTNRMSSGIFYCANSYHDQSGLQDQFGGIFTTLTRRDCETEKYCIKDILGICYEYGERKVDCKTSDVTHIGDIDGYYLTSNAFTSIQGCATGYEPTLVGYVEICLFFLFCDDRAVSVNIYACYKSDGFIQGKSYLAGFFNARSLPAKPCISGYKPELIIRSTNSTKGYACVLERR